MTKITKTCILFNNNNNTLQKVLGFSVNEKKAFQTKVVCLIHLGKFDEALSSIERNHDDTSELLFERAYCEYRMHKIEDAYATLLKCKQMTNKEKELLAQIVGEN